MADAENPVDPESKPKPKVIFRSSDNVDIRVEREAAEKMSVVIKEVLDQVVEGYEHETEKEHVVPFPYTPANILQMVADFGSQHYNDDPAVRNARWGSRYVSGIDRWPEWDRNFIQGKNVDDLKALKKVASFLKMNDLREVTRNAIYFATRPAYYSRYGY